MNPITFLQWPAMAVTLLAAWMVASERRFKRNWGFWLFLLSNVLWVMWAIGDAAYALMVLQVGLAAINIRGAYKNRPSNSKEKTDGKTNREARHESSRRHNGKDRAGPSASCR